ncbi:ABC transporter ATP-binding protein [Spirulina subsalsa FACHB-351]|uniref:ABC transporter ATP-binding protein n=1 Tax=Spirulina subsalsa FACHB-351 TaxID=234711 RepID=A0ABT3L869_9CYAN|nr:ABC transporter ATP-binding protein [Spirulina subsalsa]MCW6037299.1 ABC transporter ATP-binding protein [Spirulina subsalsa FACHB-351]
MSETIIALDNVSKCYRRYHRPIDRLKEILLPGKKHSQKFWALQDINLEVYQGETLGIIGQNGSGKSTLLQIIAKTLTPTTGTVHIQGRVAALLELGSGFNPDFTGRQNVFFNGQILGLTKKEIEAKFDTIAAFADIGDFLDQPIKTYSSGMAVRLAFAVAAHTDAQILIVDEALAVGDAKFQARCMKKIRQLQGDGVTLLFVSHDLSSVKFLCESAILLNQGRILEQGTPKFVANRYIALLSSDHHTDHSSDMIALEKSHKVETEKSNAFADNIPNEQDYHRHGNAFAEIKSAIITNLDNIDLKGKVETGSKFKLRVNIQGNNDLDDIVVGLSLRTLTGVILYGTNTYLLKKSIPSLSKHQSTVVEFEVPCFLNKGLYSISIGVHSTEGISYDWIDDLVLLEVINARLCDGLIDLNAEVNLPEIPPVLSLNRDPQI